MGRAEGVAGPLKVDWACALQGWSGPHGAGQAGVVGQAREVRGRRVGPVWAVAGFWAGEMG